MTSTTSSIPALLVTANVGSIFEDPSEMLKIWTEEFLSTVAKLEPKFIALHCQEVGGKNYENSMKHVKHFVDLLIASDELRLFDKVRVFLDEDYSSAENFTALGNLYFIHESIVNVLIYDFKDLKFVPVEGKEINSGNIEAVVTKEKAKFPQDFFPECKWSRKGFLRTRWSLNNTTFDMVNIHLFHDASNFIAMEEYPSVYCKNRRRALEHTLQRFHNDSYGKAPYFVFGDFNFRTDTEGVVKKLTEGLQSTKSNKTDHTKLHYANDESELILTVGKKEFNHSEHQKVFLDPSPTWLISYDKEPDAFKKYLLEYPINFRPSYPFEEKVTQGGNYMQTRCPAWCDRVLLSHTAKQLVNEDERVKYGLLGLDTCMGDHKPVYLRLDLKGNIGTVKCCNHAPYECLPATCQCCQSFASVIINIIDMSDYNTKNSFTNVAIDSQLLHEPITKDMLLHEPYTPESVDSHSPLTTDFTEMDIIDTHQPNDVEIENSRRNSVSPTLLKNRLELILINKFERKAPMTRSISENVQMHAPPMTNESFFRSRAMSEISGNNRHKFRLASTTSTNSVNRLQSHHSSSDEDWYEYDKHIDKSIEIEKEIDPAIDESKTVIEFGIKEKATFISDDEKISNSSRNSRQRSSFKCCTLM